VLRLGYKASAKQFGPSELQEFSVLAEQLGFESVFISDHFQPWRHNGGHAPFSLTWMGALGARTSRIQIGTRVLTPKFRYHPSAVAQAFGTLGCLVPGRMILGVGAGESLNEVPALGIEWPEPKERTARLKEALRLIRQLWSEERVSLTGEYYRTAMATIYDRPEKQPAIDVAGAGPVISKFAGQTAAGFICASGKAPELYRDTLLPNVRAGMQAASRAPGSGDLMIEMKVSFDTDLQRARDDTRDWATLALSAEEKMSVEDPLEMERRADQLPVERTAMRSG
jgi:coenzyme F420-dependent glucose-6-phosphate dehydrogenase